MSKRLQAWQERYRPREVILQDGANAGLPVLVRPISVTALVRRGTIPLTLLNRANAPKKSRPKGKADDDQTEIIDIAIMAAAIDPIITKERTDDSIWIEDLSLEDRLLIYGEATTATAAVEPFRTEPAGNVPDAPDSEDLRGAAE